MKVTPEPLAFAAPNPGSPRDTNNLGLPSKVSDDEGSQSSKGGGRQQNLSSLMINSSGLSNFEFNLKLDEKFYGVFIFAPDDKPHYFSRRSLFCLGQANPLRRLMVRVMVNRWFDRFITLCIIANSLLLASKEYDSNYDSAFDSKWNATLDKIDMVFSLIFLVECVIKITAMGFILHKRAYMRDAWNCIDFFIVFVSIVSLIGASDNSSLKAFRTARILRPLRSMHQLKSMRSLLQTFFASLPGLFNVCIFQTFIFTIFSIIGVNFFVGKHYQFCRETSEPLELADGSLSWPIAEDAAWQCSSDAMCRAEPNYLENQQAKCGDIYRDYGLDPVAYDDSLENETINYDITNFNTVLAASLTIFQAITLEGWSKLMYNYQDTVGYATASTFFVLVIIIGAFTTLNLVLAAIMHSYLQQEGKQKQKKKLQEELERRRRIVRGSIPSSGAEITTSQAVAGLADTPRIVDSQRQQLIQIDETGEEQSGPGLTQRVVQPYGGTLLAHEKPPSMLEQLDQPLDGDNQIRSGEYQREGSMPSQRTVPIPEDAADLYQEMNGSPMTVHLPQLHGQTITRWNAMKAHQDLENKVKITGEPFVSSYRSNESIALASPAPLMQRASQIRNSNDGLDQSQGMQSAISNKTSPKTSLKFDQGMMTPSQAMQLATPMTQIRGGEPNPDFKVLNLSPVAIPTQLIQVARQNEQELIVSVEGSKRAGSHSQLSVSSSNQNKHSAFDIKVAQCAPDHPGLLSMDYSGMGEGLDADQRAAQNKCYGFFYTVVTSVTFNFIIYCLIVANTVTLAMYRHDQSDRQSEVLDVCDIVFVWVFFAEMVSKLTGLGFANYLKDRFNVFDGIIVIISLVDFVLTMTLTQEDDSASPVESVLSALRALRLLRVIKLARHWKAFQEILKTMIESVIDISSFTILLVLFMFIAALLGMELFAYSVYFDVNGDPVFGSQRIQEAFASGEKITWPRENFNGIFNSLVTVFVVIVAEDWNQVMYLYVRALGAETESGRTIALAYFLVLFIIGNTIFLALFTALLLKSQEKNLGQMTRLLVDQEKELLTTEKMTKSKSIRANSSCLHSCAKKCSRTYCSQACEKFMDAFVKIFGGEPALRRRELTKRKKNPRIGASPVSGNAVAPTSGQMVQPRITPSESDGGGNSGTQDLSEFSALTQLKKGSKQERQINSFINKDAIDTTRAAPLQRPPALLHYDYDQVTVVRQRSIRTRSAEHMKGMSLMCLLPRNPLRALCDKVTGHWLFDNVVILLILVSTITIAFEHPLDDPESNKLNILKKIDIAMTVAFVLEAVLKIITFGFLFNGKFSYLNSSWNFLDFTIVIFSLLSLVIKADLGAIKVLRVARILRPLRLIQHAQGLKVAIQALFKAVPRILRLQVVFMFILFMVSILLTTLLSGKLSHCDLGHTTLSFAQSDSLITDKWDCLNYGGLWKPAALNFDNTIRGVLTLLIFQSREGWVGLMWDSVDAVGIDQAGVRGAHPFFIIVYMVLVIFLCLLFVNMFVRVVVETYNIEKDFLSFNTLLSAEQRSWIQVQIMTYSATPMPLLKENAGSCIRNTCIKIAQSRYFENFIMMCIILNTVVMSLIWFDEPVGLPETIELMNYAFMGIFTLEAIIKVVAFRLIYFRSSWNIFDFTIIVITLLILLLGVFDVPIEFGAGPTVLRALRIGRVLRLIKRAQQLQIIFHTLFDSAASLGSLGLLLIILYFMFAIIGRSLFGMSRIGDPLDELNIHVNFRDFSTSVLLLMRCSTGESWHLIMFDLARSYSQDYQCRHDETYESMMANGGEPFACGSPTASYIFFILFHILVFQIFINLFIAIIIDAFLGQSDHFKLPVQKYSIQEFVTLWSEYDPEAGGFILIKDLEIFICKLAKSSEGKLLVIQADKIAADGKLRKRFVAHLNVPTFCQGSKVMFYDVLQQLCDKVNQLNFNKKKVKEHNRKVDVLKHFGAKGVDQDVSALLNTENKETRFNFEKTIRNMGRLNPKIKLMLELQKLYKGVHDRYALFADTESNIALTDEQRHELSPSDLRAMNQEGAMTSDDINVYTTRHLYFGSLIQRAWRRRQDKRPPTHQDDINRASRTLQRQLSDDGPTNQSNIQTNQSHGFQSRIASHPVLDNATLIASNKKVSLLNHNLALVAQRNSTMTPPASKSNVRSRGSETSTNQMVRDEMNRAHNFAIGINPSQTMDGVLLNAASSGHDLLASAVDEDERRRREHDLVEQEVRLRDTINQLNQHSVQSQSPRGGRPSPRGAAIGDRKKAPK